VQAVYRYSVICAAESELLGGRPVISILGTEISMCYWRSNHLSLGAIRHVAPPLATRRRASCLIIQLP
jgi:hypothetical protein